MKAGDRLLSAQEVYRIQSEPPPSDPSLSLLWTFRWHVTALGRHGPPLTHWGKTQLAIIRAVRRCPIRAVHHRLPCGLNRFDLPPGVTKIDFAEPPPPVWEPSGWSEDDWAEAAEKAALPIAA